MTSPSESVVLCEGFHDRAFWKGWLEHLRCEDARPVRPDGSYGTAKDPFGKPVQGGQWAFRTPGGGFLRVSPCGGDNGVLKELRTRLEGRKTNALRRVITSLDNDAITSDVALSQRAESLRQSFTSAIAAADPRYERLANGDLILDDGRTVASLVLWQSAAERVPAHVPAKQTLERLVCSALCAAYPDRGAAVAAWLVARPDAPPPGPKEFAWSHMAGWYASKGCDEFYQALWKDAAVAEALRQRLDAAGAWDIVEALIAG
ncbi:hypothetical protein [Polyangium spumosum]|uniref:Uncharacterized protein n=1 Tax=Polyangium spumosum TaxID=889282 RepID=A0A6N7PS32_9BACT|nr:hypothetical protein [Polyangium spumosum]MRG94739.1 hypothetical protein [Polyangium spumosum]